MVNGVIDFENFKNSNPAGLDLLSLKTPLQNKKVLFFHEKFRIKLHIKALIIGANLKGFMCANILRNYGFRVSVYDQGKAKTSTYNIS